MKGLCLSGGGIKAAAHIGALKALEEKNIKFDCVSGASSGSIIATLYALGYNSDDMLKIFKKYSKKIKYVDFKNVIKIIYGLIFEGKLIVDGLNSGKSIEKIVNKICNSHNVTNMSDVKMPLLIPSVNLQTGTVYVATSKEIKQDSVSSNQTRAIYSDKITYITSIPIATAIRASCSYPAIISPCPYKNKQLVDGGIRENLPWKELRQIGADKVLGINFQAILCENENFKNLIELPLDL